MTVAELIKLLQQMPQDATVRVEREGYPMCDEDLDPSPPRVDANGFVQL